MRLYFILIFMVFNCAFGQQTEYVNFTTAQAHIAFGDLIEKEVEGEITYQFEILKNTDSVYIDAKNFKTISYVLDNRFSGSDYDGNHLILRRDFKAGSHHSVVISFKVQPKKAMYFIDWEYLEGNKQVWTQGQGKYTSNWLPSFDDMNEKVVFDLSISFCKDYQVIANGNFVNKEVSGGFATWHYDMQKPMSSYLLAIAIGKYSKNQEVSKSNKPLEMYYYPEDSLKFEPTYRYTKQMFDFLEDEIGVVYPWQNYKQIPVKDFLYAGMENTSVTLFSDAFVVDSIGFVDKNYVNVNAHELAHQWFGDLVTETSGTHHWLQEGFATYYALLAERNVFGDDYYFGRLYEYAQELLAQDQAGESTSLLNPKSSSVTFYKKGAWVLYMLREQVGDDAFKVAVKNYLLKYQFKNVETKNFIDEVEQASGNDLSLFVENYLINTEFFKDELIKQSETILNNLRNKNDIFSCKSASINQISFAKWDLLYGGMSDFARMDYFKRLVEDSLIDKTNLFRGILNSKDIKIRQLVAQTLTKIPITLQVEYETLLADDSYSTIETALFNLWINFPRKRNFYLNKTKDVQGFNDKNIRQLWLTLALVTEDYETENKSKYFDELTSYTGSNYGFETRQNAFQYLHQIQACNALCHKSLEQATKHHNWRFSKFAKTLLKAE
ncbi:M1 family metallopeptidase [Algibacter lectus]|uniref:M1 family metallopeptidase n=1 Tax=Algibacter lectus TaxID=221126 RepID=UPI0026EFE0C7|nr:M1 family metallopeptidase [Algibacter lectus]MDO7136761.1 M1 family metallopeptidase [Algibacter lectus]